MKREEKETKKSTGCIGVIFLLVLVAILISMVFYEQEEKNRKSHPKIQYGPVEVLEETPFSLNPGEAAVFDVRKNGQLFVYTVKWINYSRGKSYVKGSIHGQYGKDGADSITSHTVHPSLAASQPPGAGSRQYYPQAHYLRLENTGGDAVSGLFQRWGQRIISTNATIPEK